MPVVFDKEGLSSPDVSLRIEFSKANQTLTFLFDRNGATGGYQWVKQGSMIIDAGKYNLRMSAGDTFTIVLVGSSESQKVTKGQATLDNLRITVGKASASSLAVQQPAGTDLTTRTGHRGFGTRLVGSSGLERTYTVRNDGFEPLTGLAVIATGTNATDFKISPPAVTALAPGETTTFKTTFKPTAAGARSAVLRIEGNGKDAHPFELEITGMGVE